MYVLGYPAQSPGAIAKEPLIASSQNVSNLKKQALEHVSACEGANT